MQSLNLKTVLRRFFGFLNFRNMIRLNLWWFWARRDRVFFIFEGREYTYREVYRESQRYERFFLDERRKLVEAGKLGKGERLAFGIYMENTPEYLFASFGAGLSNSILFAANTGFRGETLANVLNQARISFLITSAAFAPEVEGVLPRLATVGRGDILFVGGGEEIAGRGYRLLESAVAGAPGEPDRSSRVPIDNFSPVIVIYTSGTTGMPKGVPCTHAKMWGAGMVVQLAVRLTRRDRGYISMPLFHSNGWYIGVLPQMIAGGSFVVKRRFGARVFEEDLLAYGVTFLNYVGQPLHYIIDALEKKYGSGEAVERALARDPRNRFRIAYGNGASSVDRVKLIRYLGMEHIFEIYGSTEAVITTANKPGDPIESVGRAPKSVVILDGEGRECLPGVVDGAGRLTNYDQAVGEICRIVGTENLRFDGYFGNEGATSQKFRDGIYHSGDIGHVRVAGGKRYLYFNGRTDDWIRKDGENFSAENVLQFAQELPGADTVIAYGAPCEVSDEKVMIAVQMKNGVAFDPAAAHDWFLGEQRRGMDPKWMPDYIRVVDAFPVSETQKIMVRPYKREHFDIGRRPDMVVYCRGYGDTTFHPLTPERFGVIREKFRANGREGLLRE